MNKTILFDMDGVAADWCGYMLQQFSPKYQNIDQLNKCPDRVKTLQKHYWQVPDAFRLLPKMPEFDVMFSGILDYAVDKGYRIGWLSAIGDMHHDPLTVAMHKRQWIRDNVDLVYGIDTSLFATIVLYSEHKAHYANPNTILVDDHYRNTEAFVRAGGHAVLLTEEGYDGAAAARSILECIERH